MAKLPGGALAACDRADRALVVLDVAGRTQFAARQNGQDGHCTSGVVGDQYIFAGRVDTQMRRSRALRADRIEQRQMTVGAIDRVRADRTIGSLVGGIEMRCGGVEGQP